MWLHEQHHHLSRLLILHVVLGASWCVVVALLTDFEGLSARDLASALVARVKGVANPLILNSPNGD